ncbi:hypothetical protein N665_0051s0016 [Sinapis alba]|nr:hypothetical protein N665_0051s0016 [Sinapis alba]
MDLEEFKNYPWGGVAFKVLMDSLWNKDLTKSYTIDGFVQVIQVWVYCALPEFRAEYGHPVENKPSPPLLAYNGGKGCRFFKDAIKRQDHDVEDKAADHIVKVIWNGNHHWTMECWQVVGATLGSNQKSVVVYAKNEEGYVKEETTVKEERPRKKARKETTVKVEKSPREAEETPREAGEAPVGWITQEVFENEMKQMADAMRDGFGMILMEIKHVADRVEVVVERVEALEQLAKSTKGTASNEAPHTPSELPKRTDEFGTTYQATYQMTYLRRLPGSRLSESVNGEKVDPSVSKENTEMKEVEEARGTKEAEEANAFKEAEEANAAKEAEEAKANVAREAEEAKANATKEAEEVIAAKEAEEAKAAKAAIASKEADAAKQLKRPMQPNQLKGPKHSKRPKQPKHSEMPKQPKRLEMPNRPKMPKQQNMPERPKRLEMQKRPKRWYRSPPKKKAPGCPSLWYWTLRTPLEWLTDSHMDTFINVLRKRYTNDPHMFRSERMCILDHAFAQWWMSKYPDWVSSEPDANSLGRRLPGGAWDLYGSVLAIWISIPKRHIVVWDIIVGCIRKAQLDQIMTPFVNMVPYLLVECVATVEERCKYLLEPFTYEVVNAPQCESGDCGLFALKYIECHALGFPFSGSLNPKNSKAIREKMAVDIFEEIPDAHQTEITDVDVNKGMYD